MTRRYPASGDLLAALARIEAISAELAVLRGVVAGSIDESPFTTVDRSVAVWMNERCTLDGPSTRTYSARLYADFIAWCAERGVASIATTTAFGRSLRRLGLACAKDGRGRRQRRGILLRELRL